MAKNKLVDLRDHLFETIEALKDPDNPMDVERAKAIVGVAHALIETGKIELKAEEVYGRSLTPSKFLETEPPALPPARTNGAA